MRNIAKTEEMLSRPKRPARPNINVSLISFDRLGVITTVSKCEMTAVLRFQTRVTGAE